MVVISRPRTPVDVEVVPSTPGAKPEPDPETEASPQQVSEISPPPSRTTTTTTALTTRQLSALVPLNANMNIIQVYYTVLLHFVFGMFSG
ncbi:hypothetical protein PM082_000526 [Marasmius tenuissimus]|nr:hypothetical protein PM082_000526 [Marasmius tenuissimus]